LMCNWDVGLCLVANIKPAAQQSDLWTLCNWLLG
jgi:hypothetical protein